MTYPLVRIEDIAQIKGGKRLPASDQLLVTKTDHPYVRGRDIRDGKITFDDPVYISEETYLKLKRYIVNKGDVCITIVGNIGDVGFTPAWLHGANLTENAVKLVELREDCFNKYLCYALLSPSVQSQMKLSAAGAAQPKLGIYKVSAIEVPLPPLSVQRRIASILSAYDDLIENNIRRIAILEEMARRIYEEWFVRFRFPGHEQVKMVESELGMIPEGWSADKLGNVVELNYGKALKSEERKPGSWPVYGSSGVVGYHDQFLIDGPGIIVGRKGNVGSVHWCDTGFYPIDTVYFVKSALPLHFVFFNLQKQHFINNDAAVPGLNRNQAYSLHFLVPSSDLLTRFEELCVPVFNLIRTLNRKNENLRTTRDLLLPKLISGKLDVSTLPEPESVAA